MARELRRESRADDRRSLRHGSRRALKNVVAALAIAVGFVIAGAVPARADDAETLLKAQFLTVPSDPSSPVVRIGGNEVAAGVRQYLVRAGTATQIVAAYSLDASLSGDPAAQLTATGLPDRTGLPAAVPAAYLAARSGDIGQRLSPPSLEAGAVQIAIWHFTNGLALDQITVPDPLVRARAQVLVADALRNEGVQNRAAGLKLSSFTNGGGFSDVRVDVRLVISDAPEQSFNEPQELKVNLDGIWYSACTARNNRLNARTRADAAPEGVPCPGLRNQPDDRNNAATLLVPRRDRSRAVRVVWNVVLEPGLVFLPDRRSEPVVSAGRISSSVTSTTSVDPAGFGGILDLLQARVVGLLSARGGIGFVVFFLLLYLLLKLKDVGDWVVGHALRIARRRLTRSTAAVGAGSGVEDVGDTPDPEGPTAPTPPTPPTP